MIVRIKYLPTTILIRKSFSYHTHSKVVNSVLNVLLFICLSNICIAQNTKLTVSGIDYIDPTIGNVGQLLEPTRPTVQLPNQLIRFTPQRKDFLDDQISTFPFTIVSHRQGQVFSLKPSIGALTDKSWMAKMTFDHALEINRPWYYSTYLVDDEVKVEFTAGKKTGFYRFSFPNVKSKAILLGVYNGGNFSPTVPTPANSNIYIVSSDPTPSNNGRTFIYDGAVWREITANQASTDARYLRLDGGTLVGDLTVAATKKITLTDQPAAATDAANKSYVDAAVAGATIADGSITNAKIVSMVASKLTGTVAIANGGTGASTAAAAKTNLLLNNVDNTTDLNKPISTLTQTAIDTKENTANKSINTSLGTSDVLFPSQKAVKTYVDAAVAATAIADASITDAKIISLSASKVTGVVAIANGGTGASTAAAAKTNLALNNVDNTSDVNKPISTLTGAALNAKENAANKSVTTTLGTSDVLFPTQNAVKTYVDAAIATTVIADGSITNAKIISLAATKLTGVLAVANGGTGVATITGIVKGNGASAVTAAVNGTDFSLVREIADEFSATAGQTVFTLTQTKSANSKLKMFINGVRISNTAYTLVGTTLTYTPASNASYALTLNDRIQFDYYF